MTNEMGLVGIFNMQLPIVLAIALLSFNLSKLKGDKYLVWIVLGWMSKSIHLLVVFLTSPLIDILFIDFIYSMSSGFFVLAFLELRKIDYGRAKLITLIFVLTTFLLYVFVIEETSIHIVSSTHNIIGISLLAIIYDYLSKDRKQSSRLLLIGVYAYASAHLLSLFPIDAKAIQLIAISSQLAILMGLISLFVSETVDLSKQAEVSEKLDEIIGSTFHELTPPLNHLHSDTNILLEKEGGLYAYNKQTRHRIENISSSVNRLIAVLDASINMYNPSKHLFDSLPSYNKSEVVSINSLVERAIMSLKETRTKKVTYKYEYSGNCIILCNPQEITQVLINILSNSYDSFEGNMNEIRVNTFNRVYKPVGDSVVGVAISDNGPGINREFIDLIFDKGFSSKSGEGHGLGLWIVKSLVEKNNGQISITSPSNEFANQDETNGTSVVILFNKFDLNAW